MELVLKFTKRMRKDHFAIRVIKYFVTDIPSRYILGGAKRKKH